MSSACEMSLHNARHRSECVRQLRRVRNSCLSHVRLSSASPTRNGGDIADDRVRAQTLVAKVIGDDSQKCVLSVTKRRGQNCDSAVELLPQRITKRLE